MKNLVGIIVILTLVSCKKDFSDLDVIVSSHAAESIYYKQNDYPPNSLEGIKTVLLDARLDCIELDVQMTKDNKLVLWHDANLDVNSNLNGCVGDYNRSELSNAQIYGTTFEIAFLEQAINLALNAETKLILDVKHYNPCAGEKINNTQFNSALNDELAGLTDLQKQNIIVNCRDLNLLLALTDHSVIKSLETDELEYAKSTIQSSDINTVFVKLDEFSEAWQTMLETHQADFGLYNLNNRSDVNKALEFAPDYVISDKLDYTLTVVHGK
ncbi:MAG: glycerophosphodiester phosphodiesterase family protein [Crocinitomicaceae bacterium]